MNHLLLPFLLLFSCSTQNKHDHLSNTKWEYRVSEECLSYIHFKKDEAYEDYNCEHDYPFAGKYECQNDTIFLIEIDLASDLPDEKRTVIKGRSKYIFKENYLEYVSWEDYKDNKWTNITLAPNRIIYTKVNEK